MHADGLKKLGFDLAYLCLLTKAGLKPLSRWEKDFGPETEEILGGLGLKTRRVERSVRSGKRIKELLFSKSEECLELYASQFDGTAVDRSRTSMRIEGLLFGYPSCCVESFVEKGYVKNLLERSDQRILFHWACKKCAVTPVLLPYYREVYEECRRVMRGRVLSALWTVRDAVVAEHLRRAVAMAASLVALGALPMSEGKFAGDPHWIPLDPWEDPDLDYLKSEEEVLLHMDPEQGDEDENGVPDGVDLAISLSGAIDALPTEPSSSGPYVVHNGAFGTEACHACGEQVNMGFMEIINPLENLSIAMPYIAKHYMEHGGFTYSGDLHGGRLNVMLLRTVVMSDGSAHVIPEPEGTDGDEDGLRNREEPVFGTNPENPDTDGDGVVDGVDVARELRREVESLPRVGEPEMGPKDRPFVVEHPMDGIERCPRCGEWVVMDIWDVINPVSGGYISIPSMALHFMTCGEFSWEGTYLGAGQGRVDPRHLEAVLTGEGDGHLLDVSPDKDGDLLTDGEESELGRDGNNPDQDGNKVLDGIDLAEGAASEIESLPTEPAGDHVYRLGFEFYGLEWCDICGESVNMGHVTVVNPMAELYAKVPYIGLHYMKHGSFSYGGDVHGEGRVDVKLLLEALHSKGPGHLLGVPNDSDGDGLKDGEEKYFGTEGSVADSDGDGVPDGFDLALRMWQTVYDLHWLGWDESPPRGHLYVVDHAQRGLEMCQVCGENVNMGYIEIVNPVEDIRLDIPYIGLHFMRHGGFQYSGDLHGGRVSPCLLDIVLRGDRNQHLAIVGKDTDGDGLLDVEEAHFGTRPEVADSDGDGVLDGVEVARRMRRQIESLPVGENPAKTYVIHHQAKGVFPCSVCGEEINMGEVFIRNPLADLSIVIPYMHLHFMEMGSFAEPSGGRIDPLLLEAILRPGVVIAAGEKETTLRWKGEPGKSYRVYTAENPSGPWTAVDPMFQGDGTEIIFRDDGSEGDGRKFYKIMAW